MLGSCMLARISWLLIASSLACAAPACQRANTDAMIEPDTDGTPTTPDEQPGNDEMPANSAAGAGGSAGTPSMMSTPPVSGAGSTAPPIEDDEPSTGAAGVSGAEPTPSSSVVSVVWSRVLENVGSIYDLLLTPEGHIVLAAFDPVGLTEANGTWSPRTFVIELDAEGEPVRQTAIDRAWVFDLELDTSGAIVMSGQAPGNPYLPNGEASGSVHTEAFLAKLDPSGELAWTRRLGDDPDPFGKDQRVNALALDGDGNLIITGDFLGEFDLGGEVITSAGGRDAFLAKLDPEGELIWARHFAGEGEGDQGGGDVAIDSAGDILLVGWYQGAIDLGGTPLRIEPAESMAPFVARLSPDGAHRMSVSQDVQGASIAAVGADRSFALVRSRYDYVEQRSHFELARFDAEAEPIAILDLGTFGPASVSFVDGTYALGGAIELPGETRPNAGVFPPDRPGVVVCNEALEMAWEVYFGDGLDHGVSAIALDADGSAVIAGLFGESLEADDATLTGAEPRNIFLARIAPPAAP